ncbi:MAG: hypothetical protein QJR08_05250 [Bacillota bacterium]|nr:hypothetical protein [Bacillota bacterium]
MAFLLLMLLLAWWERADFRRWGVRERWSFWLLWSLALALGLAEWMQAKLPTLFDLARSGALDGVRHWLDPSSGTRWWW